MATKKELLHAYGALWSASLEKCSVKERITIVRLFRSFRSEAEELQSFISDIRDKNPDLVGNTDKAVLQRVNELNKTIEDEGNKPAEIHETNVLTAETFEKLIDCNPKWPTSVIELLDNILVKKN